MNFPWAGFASVLLLVVSSSASQAEELRVHLGRGVNILGAMPWAREDVVGMSASGLVTQAGAVFATRGYGANYGRPRLWTYFASGVGTDFSIRPGMGVLLFSSTERTVTLTSPPTPKHGIISTVAGTGRVGSSGDGGQATEADLVPTYLAFDSVGNLLLVDSSSWKIRRIDRATGVITTIAGTGLRDSLQNPLTSGDGGPATSASFSVIQDLLLDAKDNVYVTGVDQTTWKTAYRRISHDTGRIETVAASESTDGRLVVDPDGTLSFSDIPYTAKARVRSANSEVLEWIPATGYLHVQRPGEQSRVIFESPGFELLGGSSRRYFFNIDITDTVRSLDRKTGRIEVLVGTGGQNLSVDGLPALATSLFTPYHAVEDAHGNLYIPEPKSHRIRRVDSRTGSVSTVAGDGRTRQLTTHYDGYFAGDGGPAARASLNFPTGIAFGPNGALYIADNRNCRIRKVEFGADSVESTTTVLSYLSRGINVLSIPESRESTGGIPASRIARLTGSRFVTRTLVRAGRAEYQNYLPELATPDFFLRPGEGCLISCPGNRIVELGRLGGGFPGSIETVAGTGRSTFDGDGRVAWLCSLFLPDGIAVDSRGRILVADTWNHRLRRIDPDTGVMTTIAGDGRTSGTSRDYRWWSTAAGSISTDGLRATESSLSFPRHVVLDGQDNIYTYDSGNDRLVKIDDSTGRLHTLVADLQNTDVLSMDVSTSGDLYLAVSEEWHHGTTVVPNPGPGDLYPIDKFDRGIDELRSGEAFRRRLIGSNRRVVMSTETTPVTTFGELNDGADSVKLIAPDKLLFFSGGIYEADLSDGTVHTIFRANVGETPLSSIWKCRLFPHPTGGYLIVDTRRSRVIHFTPDGRLLTIAGDSFTADRYGNGQDGYGRYAGDGGPAELASLDWPTDMAFDRDGNLLICDSFNQAIRKVAFAAPHKANR